MEAIPLDASDAPDERDKQDASSSLSERTAQTKIPTQGGQAVESVNYRSKAASKRMLWAAGAAIALLLQGGAIAQDVQPGYNAPGGPQYAPPGPQQYAPPGPQQYAAAAAPTPADVAAAPRPRFSRPDQSRDHQLPRGPPAGGDRGGRRRRRRRKGSSARTSRATWSAAT